MPRLRSSRRASGLKDVDFDHEIDLVDRDEDNGSPRPLSPDSPDSISQFETETSSRPATHDDSLSAAHILVSRQSEDQVRRKVTSQDSPEGLSVLQQSATSNRPSIEISGMGPRFCFLLLAMGVPPI
jgi:hypothetical protein